MRHGGRRRTKNLQGEREGEKEEKGGKKEKRGERKERRKRKERARSLIEKNDVGLLHRAIIGESWGMANTFLWRPLSTKNIIFMS